MVSLSFKVPAGFGGGYFRAASFSEGMPVVIAESFVPSDLGSGPDGVFETPDDDDDT